MEYSEYEIKESLKMCDLMSKYIFDSNNNYPASIKMGLYLVKLQEIGNFTNEDVTELIKMEEVKHEGMPELNKLYKEKRKMIENFST